MTCPAVAAAELSQTDAIICPNDPSVGSSRHPSAGCGEQSASGLPHESSAGNSLPVILSLRNFLRYITGTRIVRIVFSLFSLVMDHTGRSKEYHYDPEGHWCSFHRSSTFDFSWINLAQCALQLGQEHPWEGGRYSRCSEFLHIHFRLGRSGTLRTQRRSSPRSERLIRKDSVKSR